jgi:hypothetical protein
MVLLEELGKLKKKIDLIWTQAATFWLVAYRLSQLRYRLTNKVVSVLN